MAKHPFTLLLLGAVACDPNIADVVREPPPVTMPPDMPPDMPPMGPLQRSLIHRYSFEGEGTEALDSKFSAHGVIVGTSLSDTGELSLAGAKSLEYVDLPDGIVSKLTDATFEAWLTWNGGQAWQRIFDFGSSAFGEDPYAPADAPAESPTTSGGTSYLFLTPNAGLDTNRPYPTGMRVAYSLNGAANEDVCYASDQPFPKGTEHHVAVAIDAKAKTIALYQDGALIDECPLTHPLSDIDDVNNWLGRSNYTVDDELDGTYDEFRIYGAALSASEIADSFKAGPDADL